MPAWLKDKNGHKLRPGERIVIGADIPARVTTFSSKRDWPLSLMQDDFHPSQLSRIPISHLHGRALGYNELAERSRISRDPIQPFAARSIQRAWRAKNERDNAGRQAISSIEIPSHIRSSILSLANVPPADKIGLAGMGLQRRVKRSAKKSTSNKRKKKPNKKGQKKARN